MKRLNLKTFNKIALSMLCCSLIFCSCNSNVTDRILGNTGKKLPAPDSIDILGASGEIEMTYTSDCTEFSDIYDMTAECWKDGWEGDFLTYYMMKFPEDSDTRMIFYYEDGIKISRCGDQYTNRKVTSIIFSFDENACGFEFENEEAYDNYYTTTAYMFTPSEELINYMDNLSF